jgi:hypothetical protein
MELLWQQHDGRRQYGARHEQVSKRNHFSTPLAKAKVIAGGKNRIKSPNPEQRSSETAGPGFRLAHEAPRGAPPILPVPSGIVDALAEIEPDNGIAWTGALSLGFISERRERQGIRGRCCHARQSH